MPKATSASIAGVAKALSDPTRIEILRLLAGQDGALCACDIVEPMGLSQPTVSHHLRVLKEAGLVSSARAGLWVFYETTPAAATAIDSLLSLSSKGLRETA
ncbi:MAG: metalloregulator ArsR/SmtB family transcription factor [Pseudomonadota bacterium]